MRRLAAFALLVTTAGACGGSSKEGAAIDTACNYPSGVCFEFSMAYQFLIDTLETQCGDSGAVVVDSCSHDGVIGICTSPIGGTGATSRRYVYDSDEDVSRLEADCIFIGGTWTPGAG